MNIDKAMVIPLFGSIPCHECGLPAQWYVNGATLPCKCSVRSQDQLGEMLGLIRCYQEIAVALADRARMFRRSEVARLDEIRRRVDAADPTRQDAALRADLDALTREVLPA